jgi:glycerol-3-phosphate O-acyltransferase
MSAAPPSQSPAPRATPEPATPPDGTDQGEVHPPFDAVPALPPMADLPPAQPALRSPTSPDMLRPPQFTPAEPLRAVLPPVSRPVADGMLPRDLKHASAMVPRFGWLVRLFARIFFAPVQVPQRFGPAVAALARDGTVVYTLNTISLLDYLFLNFALLRLELPLSRWAPGISLGWFQPLRRMFGAWFARVVLRRPRPQNADVLAGHLRRRNAVTVFLQRAFSLVEALAPRPPLPWLGELVRVQRAIDLPLHLVPIVLVWTRNPDKPRTSILDEFFGDPEAPGRLRKLTSFLFNYRRAHLQLGEPINLQTFLRDHEGVKDEALLAERLQFLVRQTLKAEQRVIRGTPVKEPDELRKEILAEPEVAADLQRLATEVGRPLPQAYDEAARNLSEIGARFQMWMVAAIGFVLTLVWARIYEGIEVDEEGLERVREAGRRGPVVIVPSHKSHIDYLVVSYLFYRHGLIPPHIAAGDNLSFFPLGWVFRRAGAFFLRRSFTGAPIYAAMFRHYVRKLIKDGHWLEFFPEGGRSRTGKLLPPKVGLLRNVLEAVGDGLQADVFLMPVNFGYERLIEEKAYKKELEGGEKTKESVGEVLKATGVLIHKYGRIRVQFGEPISVRALLEEFAAAQPQGQRDSKAFERAVKVGAWRVLGRINEAAVITPTALVSAVLLTKIAKGIAREDLLLRVGFLLEGAVQRRAVLSEPLATAMRTRRTALHDAGQRDQHRHAQSGTADPLGDQSERARRIGEAVTPIVDQVLTLFEQGKWVVRKEFSKDAGKAEASGAIYLVKKAGRLHLDYYKNNMLHLFVPEALLAASLLALRERPGASVDPQELEQQTKFLSRLLKFEFVYDPGVGFEQKYQGTLDEFLAARWLSRESDGRLALTATVVPALRLYGKLLQNFLESYALMAKALRVVEKGPLAEAEFMERVQEQAEKAYDLGQVQCYEAISKVNLGNALKIFVEQGFVRRDHEYHGKKKVTVLRVQLGDETSANLAAYVARIEALHAPWRADQAA